MSTSEHMALMIADDLDAARAERDAARADCEWLRGPIADVAAERHRQISEEGWTLEHDDAHQNGEIALAAAAYAQHAARFRDAEVLGSNYRIKTPPGLWPWQPHWWKPKDRRRDLVRAAAMIVAEIERLDRAALAGKEVEGG